MKYLALCSLLLATISCKTTKSDSALEAASEICGPNLRYSTTENKCIDIPLKHCRGTLSLEHYQELLQLSDLKDFKDYTDAPRRTRRIAEIFSEARDRRGIFASMYVSITDQSVRSTMEGAYHNKELAEKLVYNFAKRYLGPLNAYLLGNQTEPKWQEYFRLAQSCSSSELYVLGTGVNTHLTYDLPYTLIDIGADASFESDFMKFGDVLVKKTEQSTDLLRAQQGVDAFGFFNGFAIGEALDKVAGEQYTARFIFQQVRGNAWTDFERKVRHGKSFQGQSAEQRWSRRQQILKLLP